jgi:hypothetical protein
LKPAKGKQLTKTKQIKAAKPRANSTRKATGKEPAATLSVAADDPATLPAMPDDPAAPAPRQVTLALDQMHGDLQSIGGSKSDDWNGIIATQASNAIWRSSSPKIAEEQLDAVVAGLHFIRPKDELEGMLAAQLMASHNAAMECYRRAMIPEQSFLGRSEALTQANKLSRTHAALLEALNRHRGKGQQKVTVEHVHVHEGGQAIVGNVEGGGRVRDKLEG